MATFLTLQTRVQRRLIDLPAAVLAEVPTLINKAIRSLELSHNFQVMKTTAAFTTASVRLLGAVPSNFKDYRIPPYYTRLSGTFGRIAVGPSLASVLARFSDAGTGAPAVLTETDPNDAGARNWWVWPLPDGSSDYVDGEYRVSIPYWRMFPDLSADGDSNWFTTAGEEFIVAKASASGFALDWDEEHTAVQEALAQRERNEVVLADKKLVYSTMDTLVVKQGARDPSYDE